MSERFEDEEYDPHSWYGVSYDDETMYDGEWKDGVKSGFGVLTFQDGTHYMGEFSKGLPNGFGLHTFSGGGSYSGQFEAGRYNGFGKFRRANNTVFEGSFKDGRIAGLGAVTYPDGTRDEGMWDSRSLQSRCDSTTAINAARAASMAARAIIDAHTTPMRTDPSGQIVKGKPAHLVS